ncbi:DedA family protein [Candidatus Woesearchaeota archaeon]|nr:DedA family protein [Candidatus Woesearchaeota archaeon]
MLPLSEFLNFILHIDKYLSTIIQTYHTWTYLLIGIIIFLETGFVMTPFLPGDSLLFASGSFAALGALNIGILFFVLVSAAIIGDSVNYLVGYHLGPKVFKQEQGKLFKKEYLLRTNEFYNKHGKKTIILARFIPIIRTFAPFIAGIGKMNYATFLKYNALGAFMWVGLFTFGGYFFGSLPIVQDNFSLVIIGIITCSFIPLFIELYKHKKQKKKEESFNSTSLK